MVLSTKTVPTETLSAPIVGATSLHTQDELKKRRLQEVDFALARHVLETFFRDDAGAIKSWLFPQILSIATAWRKQCVICQDDMFPQILLWTQFCSEAGEKIYRSVVAATQGDKTIKPLLFPYDQEGTTRHVDFDTARPTYTTDARYCQISHVVADTGDWEQKVAQTLESMQAKYFKNDLHVGFTIPYTFEGAQRKYVPDFVAQWGGINLIVEVTGEKKPDKAAKVSTARNLWVPAINKEKVQMIYMDPPYGIKFGSNWQVSTRKRDVKDGKLDNVTRQPEQIRAFRDTWELGIHSYLSYLRDRLIIARELLTESGSMFVQIGDENVHLVRSVMDEVFGSENFAYLVTFAKTSSATTELLAGTADYLVCYAKSRAVMKYRSLYSRKPAAGGPYNRLLLPNGTAVPLGEAEIPTGGRVFRIDNLTSQRPPGDFPVIHAGKTFRPRKGYWKSGTVGMLRLSQAARLQASTDGLYYVRFLNDFPVNGLNNIWTDTVVAGFTSDKKYVVETSTKVIERCMLMTTDPGDLVLRPHLRLWHYRLRSGTVGPPMDHHRHLSRSPRTRSHTPHGCPLPLLSAGRFTRRHQERSGNRPHPANCQQSSKRRAERLCLQTSPAHHPQIYRRYHTADGKTQRVAVTIGPQYGTVGPDLVKEAAKEAVRGLGFDLLIVCGFALDPHVSEETRRYGKLTVLTPRMNPDMLMGDGLLKKTGAANLFMVFGEPDLDLKTLLDGRIQVELRGLDVYDPTTQALRNNSTDEVACWFIDTSYNGESFFVRHAYFTGADEPYERLRKALKAEVDEAAWNSLYATTSRPFEKPKSGKIAVKVINHYGDEVLKIYAV
jgi:hypothetical protein